MKVTVEQVRDNLAKLTIEVSPEEFGVALDKAFEKVVKEVKIDGFRPGKCPKSMFIKRFGYESLYEEAVNFALNDTYPTAVEENKLYVVNQPKIDIDFATLSKDNGFTYTATVDVVPAFELGEYKGLEIKKAKETASAKEVKEQIERTLKSKAENVVKEDVASLGDTVVIDFEGFIDGEPFEGGAGQNYPLELGSNSFIPGFEDQLLGKKAEDQVDVNVTFPKDYHAELAGKVAVFKVTVHEVKVMPKLELNDEFVKSLNIENVNTVSELKETKKQELLAKKEQDETSRQIDEIVETILSNTKVDVPESLVLAGVNSFKAQYEKQAKMYGIPFETFLQMMGVDLEKFNQIAYANAYKQVLFTLVGSKIIEVENLAPTQEDIYKVAENEAKKSNTDVNEILKRDSEQIYSFLSQQKLIMFLLENKVEY